LIELLCIVVLSILLAPLVLFTSGVIRIVFGLAFVLFFPGYTLIAALFPRKTSLGGIERLALSFGLSIAVVPLIGLLLNYTPWGIQLYSVLISILVFIILMSAIAWYRRRKLDPEVRYNPKFHVHFSHFFRSWALRGLWDRILTISLVVAIAGAIGTLAYVVTVPKTGEKFTEFYVLGNDGQADGYPIEFILVGNEVTLVRYMYNDEVQEVSAALGTITLGIVNKEQAEATYHINLIIDSEQVEVYYNGNALENIGPMDLAHEEKWEAEIGFGPRHIGDSQKVEFVLYKDGESYFDDSIYIWIDVEGS